MHHLHLREVEPASPAHLLHSELQSHRLHSAGCVAHLQRRKRASVVPALQGGSGHDAQRALFCRAWLLRIAALLLLAHDGPAALPQVQDALRGFLEELLLGRTQAPTSAAQGPSGGAQAPAESVLMSVFADIEALHSVDLSTWWQQQQVCRSLT